MDHVSTWKCLMTMFSDRRANGPQKGYECVEEEANVLGVLLWHSRWVNYLKFVYRLGHNFFVCIRLRASIESFNIKPYKELREKLINSCKSKSFQLAIKEIEEYVESLEVSNCGLIF